MEGTAMQFVVWVETMIAGQSVAVQRAAVVERQCFANVPTELGLTLQEGRVILTGIEQEVVQSQVELQSGAASVCEHCQVRLRIKDIRKRRLDTVFGRVTVSCRRFIRCTCRGGMPHSIWPLASWGLLGMKRSTPERMYLLAEWGSKLPYRRAAELLNEMLPGLNRKISHTAIRRHTLAVGALLDERIIEPDEYASLVPPRLPVPASNRLTIAIDGTYVRSDLTNGLYQHYVVAGRIDRDGRLGGRFAYVAQRPGDALEFVKAAMQSHGLTDHSRVAVLADGADGLASLVKTASPEGSQSILDWFHISMRLRSIEQMAPKVAGVLKEQDPDAAALTPQKVPRIRYQMWNGRWLQAVKRVHAIYDAAKPGLETVTLGDRERLHRFRQHLFDLHEYLKNNWKSLINYAYAYHHGLRISSAPAASGMAHLVNQRMGKKQSMRWSAEGAHQLLQVRCATLDSQLANFFREWFPGFRENAGSFERAM
jgi:hypothetical protein